MLDKLCVVLQLYTLVELTLTRCALSCSRWRTNILARTCSHATAVSAAGRVLASHDNMRSTSPRVSTDSTRLVPLASDGSIQESARSYGVVSSPSRPKAHDPSAHTCSSMEITSCTTTNENSSQAVKGQ
jgi:hypothetical protein